MLKNFIQDNKQSPIVLLIFLTTAVFATIITADTWNYVNPNGTGSIFQHEENDEQTGSATADATLDCDDDSDANASVSF